MARDVSILISAKDNFSTAVKSMQTANKSFRKDLEDTEHKLNALNNTKIVLKADTRKLQDELKAAEKQYNKTGDAEDKMSMQLAHANYENARRNLSLVSKNAQQAEKDLLSLNGAVSKADNRASSITSGTKGIIGALAGSGAVKMVGDTLANVASGAIESAFGSEGSMYFSNILGSASSGAAIGTMIGGPGLGTAIGAAGGALLGAVNGAMEQYKNEDVAFKSVVQEKYDTIQQGRAETISSGSGIAANRETSLASFSTLFGDKDQAAGFLDQIRDFANVTPFLYDDLTGMSKVLKTYGYEIDELMPMMQKIGDTGAALGMGQSDMNMVATALGRMKSSNKTNAEYLNLLLERGIPAYDYLAKANGVSKDAVMQMVSKGLIPGAEAAKAIADYMGEDFTGSMEAQSKTFAGLSSTLQGMQDEMANAMGEGYNEERKKGMTEQIEWLSGESGQKMQEANKMIGEWKADLENQREAAIRKATDEMIETTAYKQAEVEGDRIKMGELMAQAQLQGENAYKLSDGYTDMVAADKSMVEMVRGEMVHNKAFWDYGYEMQMEFSKGRAAAAQEQGIASELEKQLGGINTGIGLGGNRGNAPPVPQYPGRGNAWGIQRVPYDDFPALLHEGEQVLTASEARSQTSNATVNVTGPFYVREEPDIDKIAQAIVGQLRSAQMVT